MELRQLVNGILPSGLGLQIIEWVGVGGVGEGAGSSRTTSQKISITRKFITIEVFNYNECNIHNSSTKLNNGTIQ